MRIVLTIVALSIIHYPLSTANAQNMPHEAGFWFAANGQKPLIAPDDINRGFFTDPTIEHLYYTVATNGVQALSVFAEHVNETRSWKGIWTNFFFSGEKNFPASVDENLNMTTLGLETIRNFISVSGFRVGVGLGIGYGLGGASATVRDSAGTATQYSSATIWDAFFLTALARIRYSLIVTPTYDLGIMLMGRYWSFPAIGPVGSGGEAYNGPQLRAISELGYMAGIAIGF
ncbi:MAG TPA: hypothetical protein VFX22_04670 [Candidatus Kapabacteria bacterium]|nr:hypothetical protein [Candidatus Kapabacteria bacterium]